MMLPSLFHRLHNRAFCLEIEIFRFPRAALVMVIEIDDYRFCAEDCCDGEVILAYVLLCCGTPLLLLLITCCLPSLIRSTLPYAYAPLGVLGLVEW
jgi:hypothetical protein